MSPTPSGPATTPTFVGREGERTRLRDGIERGRAGQGNTWAVTGPAGEGKTRLLQWLEGEAQTQGFRVLWGYCLKEDVSPFFPFEQIVHRLGPRGGRGGASGSEATAEGPPEVDEQAAVVVFEEEKPKRLFDHAAALSSSHPCLILGRDRPQTVRQKFPTLSSDAKVLWLSRTEGEDVISPSHLDALGELAENHLRLREGSVVALAGIEYLVSQNTFLPVLRLLQFLRDVAEGTGGKLLVSVHPAAFDAREFSLLEAEGEVVKSSTAPSRGAAPESGARAEEAPAPRAGSEPSSATLLRYVQIFESESRHRPLLLLLDDFQWADEGSALAFQFLSRNLRRAPVVLVAAVRDPEPRPGHPVAAQEGAVVDVMDNLDREGLLRRLPLKGLTSEEARSLIEGIVGAPLGGGEAEGAAETLFELTGGNPYHLLQVVGQLKEEGLARLESGRLQLQLPSPSDGLVPLTTSRGRASLPTLRRLVSHQLEGLPKEDRAFVEAAALVGREFDLPPLVDVLGRAREDLKARADRLTTRPPLLASREDGKRYYFQNPIVWEVAREELPAEERRTRARALADWYSSRRPEEAEAIARLYYEAKDRTKGLPWIRKAADRALKTQAGDAVERYVRWAEDLLRGSGEDWEGRVGEGVRLAEGIREQGALRDARRLLQGLLEAGPPEAYRWRVLRALATVQADIDPREARVRMEELERSVGALPGGPSDEARALLAVTRAHVLTLAGSWEDGLAAGREALALLASQGGGDPAERSQALYATGWCLKQLGRMDEARDSFAQGRAAAAVAERPALLCSHTNGEGAVALMRGDLPAARRAFEDAVEQCRKTGNVARVASILLNLAEVDLNLGDLASARKAAEEAQTLAERFDVPRIAANASFRMGVIYQKEKRWEEARNAFRSSLERYDRLGLSDLAYSARINLALLRGIMGDPQAALVEMDEMVRKSIGVDLRNLPLYHQARAELKGFVGDVEGARRELERGLEAARSSQNLLAQASIHEALGVWEETHGDSTRAKMQQEEAEGLYRQCGLPRTSQRT